MKVSDVHPLRLDNLEDVEEHKEDGTKEHKEMRNTIVFPSERGATAKTQDKRTRRKRVIEYSRTPVQLARLNCSVSRQRGEDAVKERPSCANAQNSKDRAQRILKEQSSTHGISEQRNFTFSLAPLFLSVSY